MTEQRFVKIATKASFGADLQAQYYNSVVFIEDVNQIWTHGEYYSPASLGLEVQSHSSTTAVLSPDKLHDFGGASSLNLTLTSVDSAYAGEYAFKFVALNNNVQITTSPSVNWLNEVTIEAGKTYFAQITGSLGIIAGWD